MSPSLPTGIVAFLFTDIEGSTPLWESQPEAMRAALEVHNAALRRAIEAQGGRVFKTIGDAFQAAFARPAEAVAAAVAAQHHLQEAEWGALGPLRVRMGVHLGPAELKDGDYAVSHTLNRVARITSAGHGGQILLSAEAADQARASLPAGVTLHDLGRHRMKGLTQLEQLFQLIAPDLPAAFPRPNTLDPASNNLPIPANRLIGREEDLTAVKRLLATSRMVTLTGSGGCGKTRLSIQTGLEVLADYPHGVWLVELAALADSALVPQALMAALGLRDESNRPGIAALTEFLHGRSVLLVLDNCEHLIAGVAQLAEALLQACPRLRCLASSREPLGIAGEAAYRVPSLAVPGPDDGSSLARLNQVAGVRLFLERAGTARPGFMLTPENAAAVAQICSRLDGIPLALELAAARVKVLSAEQISARLDDRFRLLTGGSRTALPRQQTLRALIDWSYDLLSEPEQAVFRRSAVFAGGWTLEAAESICAGEPTERFDVLDVLGRLVDKSLVTVEEMAGQARYRQLETVRQYARDRLLDGSEMRPLRDRHLDYFLRWAEQAAPELRGPHQVEWARRLQSDQDNLRVALAWALESDAKAGLRIVSALRRYWEAYGHIQDNLDWVPRLLRRPAASVEPHILANALLAQAILEVWHADLPQSAAAAEEALALFRQLGDQLGEAHCLHILAVLEGDLARATGLAQQSAALLRLVDDKPGLADVLGDLGGLFDHTDYNRARAYLDESIALLRTIGDLAGAAYRMRGAARLAIWHGDFASARALLDEAVRLQRRLDIQSDADTLEDSGRLALWQGDYDQARVYLDECLARCDLTGRQLTTDWARADLARVAVHQGRLAQARELFQESLERFREKGQLIGSVYCCEGLASLALLENQPERALCLVGWADATRQKLNDRRPPVEQVEVDRILVAAQRQLAPPDYMAALDFGKGMTLEQAMAVGRSARP